MAILLLIGRILFGGYFVYSGLNHLTKIDMMSGYAKSKNVPIPKAAVIVSGLCLLFGGAGVLLWVYVKWSLALIALFLLVVSFTIHNFWADKDPNARAGNIVNFSKNVALFGAALMLMALSF